MLGEQAQSASANWWKQKKIVASSKANKRLIWANPFLNLHLSFLFSIVIHPSIHPSIYAFSIFIE